MTKIKLLLFTILLTGLVQPALSADDHMLTAIGGYDVISYFTEGKAMRGSGFHTASHNNQIYLFSSKKNKKMFEKNQSKYAPQYNGWCAYGVSVGKKFHTDPTVFAVVDGKLYLNLDGDIQAKWNKGRAEKIAAADKKWRKIGAKAIQSL